MKKINLFTIVFSCFFLNFIYSQVGIGTTTPNGALDISSSTNGVVVPNVALTSRAVAAPVVNPNGGGTPLAGTLIWNTATAGTTPNNVVPGFYYWDGAAWVAIAGNGGKNWSTTGNSGTTAGTNFIGTTDAIDFVTKTNGTERYRTLSAGNTGFATTTPLSLLSVAGGTAIGSTYAGSNAAPTDGLRVQGKSVFGKASGEDSRDIISSHTSATSYNNVTGYKNPTASRAIAGYADAGGMGVFGFSTRTGYGVVGLTQAGTISQYVQSGEGVLGQADGATGSGVIPIGVHGIIDESSAGDFTATPVLGENNNITTGNSLAGAYNINGGAVAGVYGDIGSRVTSSSTNGYMFGVVGDILAIGTGTFPRASGGVLGVSANSAFGILGYKNLVGTNYSVYGGGYGSSTSAANTGKLSNSHNKPNNFVGIGINGGFMGGYIKGNQYGLISRGDEFGMYVQGKTIVNKPIIELKEAANGGNRIVSYVPTSTNADVTTRGKNKLSNGSVFVSFNDSFIAIVSKKEEINITVTPTSDTKGVYVSNVTSTGFYVKENQNGHSNATFNWVAIGVKDGLENGITLSNTLLSNDFDNNMNGVMSDDGSKIEGTPIYFDGQNVKFETIPENLEPKPLKKEKR